MEALVSSRFLSFVVFLLVCLAPAACAFAVLGRQRSGVALAATAANDPPPLSSLVGDMLRNQQEAAREEANLAQQLQPVDSIGDMPQVDQHGLYHVFRQDQFQKLCEAHPDKLILVQFSAPWCQACRALAKKFKPFMRRKQHENEHVIFASIRCGSSSQQSAAAAANSMQCDTMGIWQLPSMQFYAAGGQLMESFPCGPANLTWTDLQRKMSHFVQTNAVTATSASPPRRRRLLSWITKRLRRK